MPKPDPVIAKRISSLCGKLKSAWAIGNGFGTRLDGLLPEILILPPEQIDACFEQATKGDSIRQHCVVPIACVHLYHPSLHHRIRGWLGDDTLPFRDKVLEAIGRFRLHEFAPYLNRFFFHREKDPRVAAHGFSCLRAARRSAAILKSPYNLLALQSGLEREDTDENRSILHHLLSFPGFDAELYLRKWFREARVVDETEACERYIAGEISGSEHFGLTDGARVIWELAEWYGQHQRTEVIQFLVKHLDFTQTSFSSPTLSQTIVCRGERATTIIAKLNGWLLPEYQQTSFIKALWDTLRADPSLAFKHECPISYELLPKAKAHEDVEKLLRVYDTIIQDAPELGYSLRHGKNGEEAVLVLQVPERRDWRIIRLPLEEKQLLDSGAIPVEHLFHRYSSRGALVAYPDRVILNTDYLENKIAAKALRKLKKQQMSKAVENK